MSVSVSILFWVPHLNATFFLKSSNATFLFSQKCLYLSRTRPKSKGTMYLLTQCLQWRSRITVKFSCVCRCLQSLLDPTFAFFRPKVTKQGIFQLPKTAKIWITERAVAMFGEGLLDYQGRAGMIAVVRWKLRPAIFGVELVLGNIDSAKTKRERREGDGKKTSRQFATNVTTIYEILRQIATFYDNFRLFVPLT